jgi:hypothetical protein
MIATLLPALERQQLTRWHAIISSGVAEFWLVLLAPLLVEDSAILSRSLMSPGDNSVHTLPISPYCSSNRSRGCQYSPILLL